MQKPIPSNIKSELVKKVNKVELGKKAPDTPSKERNKTKTLNTQSCM